MSRQSSSLLCAWKPLRRPQDFIFRSNCLRDLQIIFSCVFYVCVWICSFRCCQSMQRIRSCTWAERMPWLKAPCRCSSAMLMPVLAACPTATSSASRTLAALFVSTTALRVWCRSASSAQSPSSAQRRSFMWGRWGDAVHRVCFQLGFWPRSHMREILLVKICLQCTPIWAKGQIKNSLWRGCSLNQQQRSVCGRLHSAVVLLVSQDGGDCDCCCV